MKWPSSGWNLLMGGLGRGSGSGSGRALRRPGSPDGALGMGHSSIGRTFPCLPRDAEPSSRPIPGLGSCRAPRAELRGFISALCPHFQPSAVPLTRVVPVPGQGARMDLSGQSPKPRHCPPCTSPCVLGGSAPSQTQPGPPAPLPPAGTAPAPAGLQQLGSARLPSRIPRCRLLLSGTAACLEADPAAHAPACPSPGNAGGERMGSTKGRALRRWREKANGQLRASLSFPRY